MINALAHMPRLSDQLFQANEYLRQVTAEHAEELAIEYARTKVRLGNLAHGRSNHRDQIYDLIQRKGSVYLSDIKAAYPSMSYNIAKGCLYRMVGAGQIRKIGTCKPIRYAAIIGISA